LNEVSDPEFKRGLLRGELFLGIVSGVSAAQARVNLSAAGSPSASHFESGRYGLGEVGELVLIEGQVDLVLGRLVDVRVPEAERRVIGLRPTQSSEVEASGFVQFLGSVRPDSLRVSAGVASYPRLGDRVYAAPHAFVAKIPDLMQAGLIPEEAIRLHVGHVSGKAEAAVSVRPEKLFGRHCAVLGATGGGKSWTIARLLEECTRYNAKVVLLDATSEYRTLGDPNVVHVHLGDPVKKAPTSSACSIPPTVFQESDFIALFEPSGKVQGPKLREAIRSLRLVQLEPTLGVDGLLGKASRKKKDIETARKRHLSQIESPDSPFNPHLLAPQLMQECIFPDAGTSIAPDPSRFGNFNDSDRSFCLPLATRIHAIVTAKAFSPVFGESGTPFSGSLTGFLSNQGVRILRVCLGGVSYEYRAREFIMNAIGRILLTKARTGAFADSPLLVFVDEAHNFLGRSVGYEEGAVRLDAFELIAREGRKYGLNLCLATQRPRDLTEGVLSQIGTLIVHRLTSDRDREIVERACGEIDRTATAFLANLREGEAAIIGVDFPIPLTIQIEIPQATPASDGPNYQKAWKLPS
jgi:DNA helicase HerA-like ATPase